MTDNIWMTGSLLGNRRSRILVQVAGAVVTNDCPEGYGICFLIGSDFQEGAEEFRKRWLVWSQKPGRVLLLLPPFTIGKTSQPMLWEIAHKASGKSKDATPLLVKSLSSEVRYELLGKLQVATELGGEWNDYSVNTGFYRKHPNAGVFAVSCLPLWSLTVLERKHLLKAWLEELYAMAGKPSAEESQPVGTDEDFTPTPDDYAMMLHLLSAQFAHKQSALGALKESTLFRIESSVAEKSFDELAARGLITGAELSESGRVLLRQSAYAAYADELEALRN
jgi:hypothetical protein